MLDRGDPGHSLVQLAIEQYIIYIIHYVDIVPMQVLTKHATNYIQMQDESIGTTSATRRASANVHGQDVRRAQRNVDLLQNHVVLTTS